MILLTADPHLTTTSLAQPAYVHPLSAAWYPTGERLDEGLQVTRRAMFDKVWALGRGYMYQIKFS